MMHIAEVVGFVVILHGSVTAATCPSFTSSVEEGRAVCPGEELTYNCTIFDDTSPFQTVWKIMSKECSHGSILVTHSSSPGDEACGPFTAQHTASDGDCHTSTLTVNASLELNGTVVTCEDNPGTVAGNSNIILYTPSPVPIPTQNPSTDTLTSTTIQWSVPGDSGPDITSYTITYTSESCEHLQRVRVEDGSVTSALLTGLTPNVDYEANITASNCAGPSKPTAFSFRILGTVPLSVKDLVVSSNCGKASDISLLWKIPHPPPPPAYEPVEAVWVNYTVEKEDGATSEMSSGPLPPSTESFVIENATLGAAYTITVSAVNQLGWSRSSITTYNFPRLEVSTSFPKVLVIWTDQTSECYRVHLSHGSCDGPKQDTSCSISEERVIAVPLGDTGPQGSYCYEVGFETSEGVLIGGAAVAGTVDVLTPSYDPVSYSPSNEKCNCGDESISCGASIGISVAVTFLPTAVLSCTIGMAVIYFLIKLKEPRNGSNAFKGRISRNAELNMMDNVCYAVVGNRK